MVSVISAPVWRRASARAVPALSERRRSTRSWGLRIWEASWARA